MKKTTNTILSAAVAGLFLGSTYSCGAEGNAAPSAAALQVVEKHACKGLSSCAGLGGCKTELNECAGMNECEGMGGCATVAYHDCAGKNDCKAQGGCKTADHDCAGKNECKGLGGCQVPVKKK